VRTVLQPGEGISPRERRATWLINLVRAARAAGDNSSAHYYERALSKLRREVSHEAESRTG
jgi:hypothetical protein